MANAGPNASQGTLAAALWGPIVLNLGGEGRSRTTGRKCHRNVNGKRPLSSDISPPSPPPPPPTTRELSQPSTVDRNGEEYKLGEDAVDYSDGVIE